MKFFFWSSTLLLVVIFWCCSPDRGGNHELSLQGGTPGGRIQVLPDTLAQTPYLFTDDQGEVYLSWTQSVEDISTLKFAQLLPNYEWSEPTVVAHGKDWFVNWADYPAMAKSKDRMIANYLAKSSDATYSYDIRITNSSNRGKSWAPSQILHEDGIQAEHGFVSIVPFNDNFFITWLDGRSTGGNVDHENSVGAMTLRAAVMSPEGTKLDEWELDQRVCDCCQTSAGITTNGPIVVYRDRSSSEVRDISIVRYVNESWTAPQPVHEDNWQINGCPVNGPRVSVLGNNIALGWYTMVQDTPRVNLAFSFDGGATFSKPVRVDSGNTIGRLDVEWINKKEALISWMEVDDILLARVSLTQGIVQSHKIASSSYSRSSGFPQMALFGQSVVIAWTDPEERKIKTTSFKF